MSQYLLNIDSTYRDQKLYRFSTEFGVMVNPTPGQNAAGNIYVIDNIIYSKFKWEGNTTTVIPNDTIEGNFTDFSSSAITLDPAHASTTLNYYLGCQFVVDSGQSSVITFYDNETNTVRLENPLPPPSTNQYKIINPSYVYPDEMLLLGSNIYVNLSNENLLNAYFLKSGPTNALFIQNVTQGWVLPIHKILEKFKVVTFETDIPSYANGDLFQIRESANLLVYTTLASSASGSILEYQLVRPGNGYTAGEIVYIGTGTASYRIDRVDPDGGIVALVLISPGDGYSPSVIYQIVSGGNTSATLVVVNTGDSIAIDGTPYPDGQYLLYVPSISPFSTAFFPVLHIEGNIVFFSNPDHQIITDNIPVELMIYRGQSTGLNMPLVSYAQAVCYEVSLIHLIIPNQPVFGYNVLPTFFPYVMVELYNVSTPTSNAGILYTNNPHTDRVTFYCPIGNPKNPLIVSYLIIPSATQVQLLKWAPLDNFFFRVLLPNGETLKYNFDLDINETDIINGDVAALATTEFHFWGQMTDRRVSATFSFRLRS